MDTVLKTGLWDQFGASIDMLAMGINLCPDELWTMTMWKDTEDARYGQFWFIAYHTLFWTDLFLSGCDYKGFLPPPPFVRGKLPEIPFTKAQIITYLDSCRSKCQSTIEGLTDETAYRICKFEWIEATFLEMMFYAMRHVQEHGAQLNLVLGQRDIVGMDWIAKAEPKAI